jgi:HD superfamily phosphohydrolase
MRVVENHLLGKEYLMTNSWDFDDILKQLHERYQKEGLPDYWEAESAALAAALKAIASKLPERRYTPLQVLGVGGSGVVLRVADALFPKVDKALKFPRPVAGKVQLVAEMLGKEIKHLAELRHPGIVGIDSYSVLHHVKTYVDLPYYLMEFVDGSPSRQFVRHPAMSELTFRGLVRQVGEILAYLHDSATQGFAHLDIKPDNIVVTATGRPVLIDLGTCKRLQGDHTLTTVACTRPFAHPELVRRLVDDPSDENRAKGELPRSEINAQWDLWSFGLTLLDWLGVDLEDGRIADSGIFNQLSSYSRKYYMLLAARLLSYSVRSWLSERVGLSATFLKDFPINSAIEVCDLLARLDGSGGPLSTIPELAEQSSATMQVAPNMHVPRTPALLKLLEHRLYQRLNSVNQLGVVSQVYAGAKHTRREHSLGTYANTARALHALYNDSYSPLFRQIVTEEDCRTTLLAALVHDIGQFPLAHDLEEMDKKVFSHAEITLAMLKGEWHTKKRGAKRIVFDSLDPVFEVWGTTVDRIISLLSAKPSNPAASRRDKLLRSIFSGPIDADKLDYLLRDARHTDVPYPFGVDVDRIFRCLTTVVIDRVQGTPREVPSIGVHAKGKVAAEFLTLARYAMFSQVYWHHAVRAQKSMLFRAVGTLLADLHSDAAVGQFKSEFIAMISALPESLYHLATDTTLFDLDPRGLEFGPMNLGTDLVPTDAAVLSWFSQKLRQENHPDSMLIDGILSRRLFKRLWVVSYEMQPTRWDKIVNNWDQMDRLKRHRVSMEFERAIAASLTPDRLANVTALKATEARDKIEEYTAGEIPWLLIDIPGNRPGAEIGLYYVHEAQRRQLRKDARAVGDLQTSPVWERYGRDLRQTAGKIRVFCDPMLVDTVESSLSWENGIDVLESVIEQSSQ